MIRPGARWLRRLALRNSDLIALVIGLGVAAALGWVSICYLPAVPWMLRKLGVPTDDPLVLSVLGTFAAAVLLFPFRRTFLARFRLWSSRLLLPVNRRIRPADRQAFNDYHKAVSRRIRRLLPEEIEDAWDAPGRSIGLTSNPNLIALRADEVISVGATDRSQRISDVFAFFDVEFFLNLSASGPRMLLQGDPGSGKSTLLFELYRQQAFRLLRLGHGWIPIFLFSHEFSWALMKDQKTLQGFLVRYFEETACQVESDDQAGYARFAQFLDEAYRRYQFVIFIDGLDEIPNRPLYERMTRKLNALLEAAHAEVADRLPDCVILSCRSDDNQRIITGRVITLLPLEIDGVLRHLGRLIKHHKRRGQRQRGQAAQLLLDRLRRNQAHKLLQNYVLNPYLLSLIVTYYRDIDDPPASKLSEIFEHVLARELGKPRRAHEPSPSVQHRVDLRRYLVSLVAPYCFRRTMDTLSIDDPPRHDFRRYIDEDPELSKLIVGDANHPGYLRSICQGNSKGREDAFQTLTELWGLEKTRQFREVVDRAWQAGTPYETVEAMAFEYLYRDVMGLLADCNLAEIDPTTGAIQRFRHRRMQDYFTALFLDRIGVESAQVPLANAWMREPLRILAAIATRPASLIEAFQGAYDHRSGEPEDVETLNGMADLMVNAAEAVAYLPRATRGAPDQHVWVSVLSLGERARALYERVSR